MAVSRINEAGLNINQYGNRNLIINGAMNVAQRGTSAVTATANFPVDRFRVDHSTDGAFTGEQSTDVPSDQGFTKSMKYQTTTADSSLAANQYFYTRHIIEGLNSAHLMFGSSSAKTVTLSFWVKSSLTGTFGGSVWNDGFNRSYPYSYTISAANTWEKKTITITGDTSGTWLTTNGRGINIGWGLGLGSDYSGTAGAWAASGLLSVTGATSLIGTLNATWYITGVQLEVGDTATDFEHRTFADELHKCQRYYAQGGVILSDATPDRYHNVINLPCEMRAQPTVSSGGIDSGSGGTMVSVWDSSNSSTSKRNFYQGANNSVISNSWFAFDAEL